MNPGPLEKQPVPLTAERVIFPAPMSESLSNSLCGWVPNMKKLGTEKEESGKFCNGPRRDAGTWKRRNEDAEQGWDARDLLKINVKDLQKKVLCVIVLFMFILLTGHGSNSTLENGPAV